MPEAMLPQMPRQSAIAREVAFMRRDDTTPEAKVPQTEVLWKPLLVKRPGAAIPILMPDSMPATAAAINVFPSASTFSPIANAVGITVNPMWTNDSLCVSS